MQSDTNDWLPEAFSVSNVMKKLDEHEKEQAFQYMSTHKIPMFCDDKLAVDLYNYGHNLLTAATHGLRSVQLFTYLAGMKT